LNKQKLFETIPKQSMGMVYIYLLTLTIKIDHSWIGKM